MALLSKMVSLICVRGRRVTLQAIPYRSGLSLHSSKESDANADANLNDVNRRPRKRSRRWLYCSHCKQNVSTATYYRHKKLRISENEGDLVNFNEVNQKRLKLDSCDIEVFIL